MRVVRGVFAILALAVTAIILVAACAVYLGVTGRDPRLTRALVERGGVIFSGQHTEDLNLDVRLRPDAQTIAATARLAVRVEGSPRRRLFFLLNDGLSVRSVYTHDGVPLPAYRLGMLRVIELPQELRDQESIQISIHYEGSLSSSSSFLNRPVLETDDVLLHVTHLWYPVDLQGFFRARVRVTLPSRLMLVHAGAEQMRSEIGTDTIVEWKPARPVQALALVAGRYEQEIRTVAGRSYRVYLPPHATLDPQPILDAMRSADEFFTERYGNSGYSDTALFVNSKIQRAFNDGSGVIGMAPGYFTRGDYGYTAIAHEIAHHWWGATVAEKWLRPGTGGEWIVEGFAEFSSWMAARESFGEGALLELLSASLFDPSRTRAVADMSAIDNAIDPDARQTIYNKGAYVTFMLAARLGEEKFYAAARAFLERFRHRAATDQDLEKVFAEHAGSHLSDFFASWVRSDATIDLALEPNQGSAELRNFGRALAPPSVDLWRIPPEGEPERQSKSVGTSTPIGNSELLIADPLLRTPDTYRHNNVLPRGDNPRLVARSQRGQLMIVYGEPYTWAPAIVVLSDLSGRRLHEWSFDSGIFGGPKWSEDGTRILVLQRDLKERVRVLALNVTDGSQQTVWRSVHRQPEHLDLSGSATETIVTDKTRLFSTKGKLAETIREEDERTLAAPLASPDGSRIAYASRGRVDMELRLIERGRQRDRVLFTWPRGPVWWQWSADGTRILAILTGDWDWQLWEISLEGGAPRVMVREAANLRSLAPAPDGERIAFVATADLAFGNEHREVFILAPRSGAVQRIDLPHKNAHSVAWLDDQSLAVIVSDRNPRFVPVQRKLKRLSLGDGTLDEFP